MLRFYLPRCDPIHDKLIDEEQSSTRPCQSPLHTSLLFESLLGTVGPFLLFLLELRRGIIQGRQCVVEFVQFFFHREGDQALFELHRRLAISTSLGTTLLVKLVVQLAVLFVGGAGVWESSELAS